MSLTSWTQTTIRYDKRALKVLTQLNWTSAGWRMEHNARHPDEAYAREAGYLYDDLAVSHDEAVDRAIAEAASISAKEVADGFLASLSTRRLELRSALGSFALASQLHQHAFVGKHGCRVCCGFDGVRVQDYGRQNFERYRWGGVRHLDPAFMWFDLHLFRKTERPVPKDADHQIFQTILDRVRSTNPDDKAADLAKAVAGALPSNSWERRILVQIMSYAGLLEPADHPGFSAGWVPCAERAEPHHSKNDWTYPVVWWRGKDGINNSALRRLFPGFTLLVS